MAASVTNFKRSKKYFQNFSWQSCIAISYVAYKLSMLLSFLIKMIKYITGLKVCKYETKRFKCRLRKIELHR